MPFVKDKDRGNKMVFISRGDMKTERDQIPPQVIYENDKSSIVFPQNASELWTFYETKKKK